MLPKSVTLNGRERHNDRYFALFYRSFWANYVKVVDDSPISVCNKNTVQRI